MMTKPSFEPCIHSTPNAFGTVSSELHGVCIFCWRDWWGKEKTRADKLQEQVEELTKALEVARTPKKANVD